VTSFYYEVGVATSATAGKRHATFRKLREKKSRPRFSGTISVSIQVHEFRPRPRRRRQKEAALLQITRQHCHQHSLICFDGFQNGFH